MATDEETAEKAAKVLEVLRGLDVEAETRRLRESWHDALKRLLPHGLPANLTAEEQVLLDVTYVTLQPSGKTPEDVQRVLDAVAKAAHAIACAPKAEHDALLALLRIALMGLAARLTD